jgi:hypothetical protein
LKTQQETSKYNGKRNVEERRILMLENWRIKRATKESTKEHSNLISKGMEIKR